MSNRKLGSLVSLVAGAAVAFSMVGGMVAQAASALTQSQITAIVSLLQSFGADAGTVANVTAALNGQATTGTVSTPVMTGGYNFATNLTVGSTGADVTALQQFLVAQSDLVMPAGTAYGYFGSVTKAAVIKFQLAKGISPAAGYVGSITRGVLNSMGGSMTTTTGGTTTFVPNGTSLNVSLAPTSPASGSIVAGQAAADLAEYTFTNTSATPAVVTNVTLQKVGVVADTAFDNIYLYQGATRLTDAASISSGKISFNSGSGLFTVPAGSSITVSVKVDVDSSANGQLMGVSLTGITANVPVSAVYPISGATMSTFTASDLASAALGTITPSSAVNVNAGTLNYSIFSAPLTISGKDTWLTRASFKVIGSLPTDALQNIGLYVSGVKVATASGIDANDYITFDLSSNPYKIQTGSKTLEVRADVIKGTDRSFTVSIQNTSDLGLVDSNYNVGIAASGIGATAQMSVSLGNIAFTQDSTLSSGDVVAGASNIALGRYDLKAYGEDVKITELHVAIQETGSTSTMPLTNVSLYANGSQVGSSKTVTPGTDGDYTLGSSLVIPAGQTVVLEVRGDLKDASGNNVATGTQIIAVVKGVTGNAQGLSSNMIVGPYPDTAGSQGQGPALNVVGAGLTVAKNASVNDSSAMPNGSNQLVGSFVLQANSSEAEVITGLKVTFGGSIDSSIFLSNLTVNVSGVGSTQPIQPLATGTVNNLTISQFTIPVNGSVTVNVYADIGNTSGTTTVSSLAVTGYGASSNVDLSGSTGGQVLTVAAGAIGTPILTQTSPASQILLGGVTNSTIAIFNATSSVGSAYITELQFNTTGNAIASITVGGTTKSVSSGATTTVTLATPIRVDSGYVGVNIPVYVNYTQVGGNGGVTSNQANNIALNAIKYTSGNTSTTTYMNATSATMYPVAGMPSVSVVTGSRLGLTGGSVKLADVRIAALGNAVRLVQLPVNVTTSGPASSTDDSLTVYDNSLNQIVATGTVSGNTVTFSYGGQAGYTIYPADGTHTFSIYTNAGVNTSGGAGTVSFTTDIGTPSAFNWYDVQGQQAVTGSTLLLGYPKTSDNSVIGN